MRLLHLFLAALATALAACGKVPPPARAPACPPAASPVPLVSPPAPGAPPEAVVGAAIAAARALGAYTLEMRWEQKQGATRSRGVYAVAGLPPRTTRVEIKEGASQGTKVLYRGGTTAKVRLGGLLGALALDLPVDDERLRSVRGYTLAQTDLPALLTLLGDPRHRATALGEAAEGPRVALAGGPLLPGCQRVEVTLSRVSGLPARLDFHDVREVVYRIELRDFRAARHASLEL